MAKDDELKQFVARAATGVQNTPEDARRILLASGVKPEEVEDLAATASTNTVEWSDPTTRQHRSPAVAPESLVQAEEQGLKDLEKVAAAPETTGTDTNDPDVNLMATGPANPGEAGAIGASGQVADKGDSADKADKATEKSSK